MFESSTAFGFAHPSIAAGFAVRASMVIEDRKLVGLCGWCVSVSVRYYVVTPQWQLGDERVNSPGPLCRRAIIIKSN
jgi:hypothetical protein